MKKIYISIILVIVLLGASFVVYNKISYKKIFNVLPEDKIENWRTSSVYNDQEQKEVALKDIKRLKGLIGKGEYPDYEIYISIANKYHLIGDGKKEYEYLNRALEIDSEKTGLAWYNMGVLMEKLGALNSAKTAYKNAYESQATVQYVRAYNDFVEKNFPNERVIDLTGANDQSSEFFE